MADPSEFVLLSARRVAFPRMPQLQSCTADRPNWTNCESRSAWDSSVCVCAMMFLP